jgi:outer membrane protein assembly factor BamB
MTQSRTKSPAFTPAEGRNVKAIRDGTRQIFLACIAVLVLTGFSFGQFAISLSASSGPPTGTVLVSGSGFSPNAAIDIYFDSTNEATTNANGSGSFSNVAIAVPSSAVPGSHSISARQVSTQTGAKATFLVRTNWSEFGFTANGQRLNPYENVLSTSTASQLGFMWKFGTPGYSIQSSPAVANGAVYFGSDDHNVYALNAKTGAKLWNYTTGSAVSSSPALAKSVVYVGSDDYNVYALNASTGAKIWNYTTNFVVDSSPALANGVVYIGSADNNVYALDAATGAKLWSFTTGNRVDGSPAVANGVVYVGSEDYNVYALNASTGSLLWSYATFGPVDASPAVADGVVYIGYTVFDNKF